VTPHDELIEHLKGVRYIVINVCHGGFGLSQEAVKLYLDRAGLDYKFSPREDRYSTDRYGPVVLVNGNHWSDREIDRDDPALVSIVRELGKAAAGPYAELKIVKIPADVKWEIAEYDGSEWVAEQHRTWC
jgi:hypothetical protein